MLQCGYHGWSFDGSGECRHIPSSTKTGRRPGFGVPSMEVVEQQGIIWGAPSETASTPPWIEVWERPDYAHFPLDSVMPANLLDTAENILDVPHTAYLHGGWFRTEARRVVEVHVRRGSDLAAARFLGEPAPAGLLGRILAAPKTDGLFHEDRFRLPCIAEVEYRLGDINHLHIVSLLTPSADLSTRVFSTASLRLRTGQRATSWLARPFAKRVLAQDAAMLRAISESTSSAPELPHRSAEIDVLGPHIRRLIDDARTGASTEPWERRIAMRV